ncbi:hypothetical protein BJ165DRAFT_760347 [Panaeolus papilionaceus]|nr:hypothetical protein BJ165DRAFT_760347 [Panaeolus papilionaceus]
MNPVFPLEILTYIIEILGNDKVCKDNLQPHNLGSCALTCKLFASLCRPYTFRCIYLGRNPGSPILPREGVSEKRLFCLLEVFQAYPHLGDYVREFTIIKTDFGPKELTSTEIRRCKTVFLSFSKLQSLSILYIPRDRRPPDSWNLFAEWLAGYYIRQGGIQSLTVQRPGKRPSIAKIFTSSGLQHLEIEGLYVGYYGRRARALPTSNITSLIIPPTTRFPLPCLLALPNLEILHFSSFFYHVDSINDHRLPSFRLKELLLVLQYEPMQPLIDFYLNHAKRRDIAPFSCLESLDITATSSRDLQSLQCLLNQEFCLKTFRFKVTLDGSVDPCDPNSFSRKLKTCTSVTLCLQLTNLLVFYDWAKVITDMFSYLAHDNVLESLELTLACPIYKATQDDPRLRLCGILTKISAFPALKELTIGDWVVNLDLERQKSKACQ